MYIVTLGRVYRRDTPDATHTPTFHQVEGLAVDEGITLGDLEGTLDYLLKALFGEERRTGFGRTFPFTEPSVEAYVSCHVCDGRGLPGVPSLGLDRGRRLRDGRPEPLRVRGLRPGALHGLRLRLGARAHRRAPPRDPRSARPLAERPPPARAVLMRVPLSWLPDYVNVDATPEEIARRLADLVARGRADPRRRRPRPRRQPRPLPRRPGARGRNAPERGPAAALPGRRRRGRARQIVCGAWNFEAGATVAVALPGRSCPLRRPLEERELRGQPSPRDDPRRGRGRPRRRPHGDHRAGGRARAGHAARGRAPDREQVLDVTPTMNRSTCCRCTGSRARSQRCSTASCASRRSTIRPSSIRRAGRRPGRGLSTGCPRYIGRVFRDVRVGPSPHWLRPGSYLAEMRSISNVVDVTNYVMHVWGARSRVRPLEAREGRIVVRRARSARRCGRSTASTRELGPRIC